MKLLVKKLSPNGQKPTKKKGNAGYDLFAAESVTIPPLSRRLIKTGITIEIPSLMYGHISDRSGMAWKKGAHCMGKIIDPSYRGEWGIVMLNTDKDTDIVIEVGDKVAQVVFKEYKEFDEVEWAEDLSETERGEKGWGPSGK